MSRRVNAAGFGELTKSVRTARALLKSSSTNSFGDKGADRLCRRPARLGWIAQTVFRRRPDLSPLPVIGDRRAEGAGIALVVHGRAQAGVAVELLGEVVLA